VLWRNDGSDGGGGWTFTDVSVASGSDISLNGMGLGVGDYDNNGWLDIAFSNIGPNYLLHNEGDGSFADLSAPAGIQRSLLPVSGDPSITWGTAFFDHDNDGLQDLFFAAGWISPVNNPVQPNAFFANLGNGHFADLSFYSGLDDVGRARSTSIMDFDADGFVDVMVGNYGEGYRLFRNNGNGNNWLQVTVEGTLSNRDGIGTRIWFTTPDGVTQMQEINSGYNHGGGSYRMAHFGLGQYDTGTLLIRWPNGLIQQIYVGASNQSLHIVQPDWMSFMPLMNRGGN
jgi:hypothetical protein